MAMATETKDINTQQREAARENPLNIRKDSSGRPTKEYVLKANQTHNGVDELGQLHTFVGGEKDNDRVWLRDDQYYSFRDKFESLEDQKSRVSAQNELNDLRAKQNEIEAALKEKGFTLEELLAPATIKKPNPTPGVGTAEPTQADVTPAPTGSTADPVNNPPGRQANTEPAPAVVSAKK